MKRLRPLNLYGWSKHAFDLWAMREAVAATAEGFEAMIAALPDAQVWGEVDPVDAALLVMDRRPAPPASTE